MQCRKKNIVIMNYKKNGDLMNEVDKNGKLNPKIVLKLTRQILDCLSFIYAKGLFHGDLKP